LHCRLLPFLSASFVLSKEELSCTVLSGVREGGDTRLVDLKQGRSAASGRVTFRFSLSTNNRKEGRPKLRALRTSPPSRGQALSYGFACRDGIFRWHIRVPAKNDAHRAHRPPPSRGQALRVLPSPPAAAQSLPPRKRGGPSEAAHPCALELAPHYFHPRQSGGGAADPQHPKSS